MPPSTRRGRTMSDALNFLGGALMVASLALLIALLIERLYWLIDKWTRP